MTKIKDEHQAQTDDYLVKLRQYKLAELLLKKMLRSESINALEYSKAVDEIKDLYGIRD